MHDFLKYVLRWFTKPGEMYVIRTELVMSKMVCVVAFPSTSAPDVTKRELVIKESDKPDVTVLIDPPTLANHEFRVEQDANVTLELRDTDDSGNIGEPSIKMFTASDTVPPPMPGEMNITIIGEEA